MLDTGGAHVVGKEIFHLHGGDGAVPFGTDFEIRYHQITGIAVEILGPVQNQLDRPVGFPGQQNRQHVHGVLRPVGRVAAFPEGTALVQGVGVNFVHGDVQLFGQNQLAQVRLLLVNPHFQSVAAPAGNDTGQLRAGPQMGVPPGRKLDDVVGFLKSFRHIPLLGQLAAVDDLVAVRAGNQFRGIRVESFFFVQNKRLLFPFDFDPLQGFGRDLLTVGGNRDPHHLPFEYGLIA